MVTLIWSCYRYIVAYNIFTLSDLLPTTISQNPPSTTILTSDAITIPSFYKTDDERQFQLLATSSLLPPKYEEIIKTADQATTSPPSYVLTQQQQQENQHQNEERM